jgi:hypothetical protein
MPRAATGEDADGNEKDTTVAIPYGISFNAKEVK